MGTAASVLSDQARATQLNEMRLVERGSLIRGRQGVSPQANCYYYICRQM